MNRFFTLLILLLATAVAAPADTLSLEQCQEAAARNYPAIKQYDLITRGRDAELSNIARAWLPQVTVGAQATYQSDVVSWPEQMRSMLVSMNMEFKGLRKDQYRVGVDINQWIYDGGEIGSRKELARRSSDVDIRQTEVTLYAIRDRVNELYFGVLLLNDRLALNADLHRLLAASEEKLSSLVEHGAAAEGDYSLVKAERLSCEQQQAALESSREAMLAMLSLFCGSEVTGVVKPDVPTVSNNLFNRPELNLFEAQRQLVDAREHALDAALRPKFSLFAQGYYGYPGYNMFEDMVSHRWSLNGMVGVKMTWNIGALYTRNNDKARLELQRRTIDTNREVFRFNNDLEQVRLRRDIELYHNLMSSDDEIIALRASVRRAAESRLDHGIIDATDLIAELNNEHAARVQRSTHELEWLKRQYSLQIARNN